MDISYLHEFVVLAHVCQFQKAAEELFISQSTLSKHIKLIEQELGAPLFIRSTRYVELSEVGKAFLSYAIQISMIQQDYTDSLLKSNSIRKIKIGSDPIISLNRLEGCLAAYIADHPNLKLEFSEKDKNTLRAMLRKGEYDLIVGCRDISDTNSEFFSYPYSQAQLVAVMSASHPLSTREALNIRDLKLFPCVQWGSINFAQYLDPVTPEAQYKSVRATMIIHILSTTQCISICPFDCADFLTKKDIGSDLIILPIEASPMIYVDLICLEIKKNSPFIQTIINHIESGN